MEIQRHPRHQSCGADMATSARRAFLGGTWVWCGQNAEYICTRAAVQTWPNLADGHFWVAPNVKRQVYRCIALRMGGVLVRSAACCVHPKNAMTAGRSFRVASVTGVGPCAGLPGQG